VRLAIADASTPLQSASNNSSAGGKIGTDANQCNEAKSLENPWRFYQRALPFKRALLHVERPSQGHLRV